MEILYLIRHQIFVARLLLEAYYLIPTISIKLEHLAKEHGIDVSDAHDAISDCKFMIGLCRKIKDKIN